jgi:hypothetical protein
VPLSRRLRPKSLSGAIEQSRFFAGIECGGGVHRQIEPRRHVPSIHLNGDILCVPLRAVPLAKVQVPAPAVDVSLNKPGCRRNVRIPEPHGFIAMAVEAGAAEQFPGGTGIPLRLPGCPRVGMVMAEGNELDQYKGDQAPPEDPEKHLSSITCDLAPIDVLQRSMHTVSVDSQEERAIR